MARVKNNSGEEIPAWAIMLVSGVERNDNERPILKVDKPSIPPVTFGRQRFLINGPVPIGVSGDSQYGHGSEPGRHQWVGYNTGDGTPVAGSMWGVENGQWHLQKDAPGWTIDGLNDQSKERVLASFNPDPSFYFVLNEDLSAPSGDLASGAAPTTASATIFTDNASGTLSGGVTVTLTSRWDDLTLSAQEGGWCKWDWTLCEWAILATECPG